MANASPRTGHLREEKPTYGQQGAQLPRREKPPTPCSTYARLPPTLNLNQEQIPSSNLGHEAPHNPTCEVCHRHRCCAEAQGKLDERNVCSGAACGGHPRTRTLGGEAAPGICNAHRWDATHQRLPSQGCDPHDRPGMSGARAPNTNEIQIFFPEGGKQYHMQAGPHECTSGDGHAHQRISTWNNAQ